jgi:uncharacterized protein YndB with AHSA1/START domain
MSNIKKVSSVKKSNAKKTTKPAKSAVKKNVAKKVASKPTPKKKIVKPVAKKPAVKVIAKKKIVSKKPISKKVTKPVKAKPTKKVVVKKAVSKKPIVTKKPILKKIEPKKAAVKVIPKKVEAKKVESKKEKPAKEVVKPSPVVLKKEIAPVKVEKTSEPVSKKLLKEATASTEVLAINNTIPKKEKIEISPSKIASISSSITNPIKKTDSYAIKPEKEPNGKFELEFVVHASADMFFEFLSTPSGLSEWFCDDVNIRNGIYTFIWDGQMQQARLLKTIDVLLVRFQWVDKNDGSYFEFRIQRDDLTNDISLIITDFADSNSERESAKLLWHSQVEKLMHVIGSIF